MTDTIKKIIEYYAHHDVSPETREKVLKRLSTTKDCEMATETYQQLWNEIEVENCTERKFLIPWYRSWLKKAAVLIPLIMLMGVAEFYVINSTKQVDHLTLLYQYTRKGENKAVVLPDGTKVNMNGGTVIQSPSSFTGNERRVYLNGEAFFDIHHSSSKPFHVVTPYFDITDIGTSFRVSSYMTTDEVYVYVKTGCVELHPEKGNKSYKLSQNENLLYNVKNGEIKVGKGMPNIEPTWKTAQITIDNLTLAETMKKLSNVYGVNITIQSKKNYNQCITAHFNRGETLEGVLRIINNIFPDFRYKIDGDNIIVY